MFLSLFFNLISLSLTSIWSNPITRYSTGCCSIESKHLSSHRMRTSNTLDSSLIYSVVGSAVSVRIKFCVFYLFEQLLTASSRGNDTSTQLLLNKEKRGPRPAQSNFTWCSSAWVHALWRTIWDTAKNKKNTLNVEREGRAYRQLVEFVLHIISVMTWQHGQIIDSRQYLCME